LTEKRKPGANTQLPPSSVCRPYDTAAALILAAEAKDQNYKDNDDPDELVSILAEADTANVV